MNNKIKSKKFLALFICTALTMLVPFSALANDSSKAAGTYGTLSGSSSMSVSSTNKYLGLVTRVSSKAPDYIGYGWALTVSGSGTPINNTEQVTSRGVKTTGEQVELNHYRNPVTGAYDHFANTTVVAYCNHFCYGSYGSYTVYTSAIK